MAVSSVSGSSSTSQTQSTSSSDPTGFSSLNSQDFLKLLLAQLQNQDPLNPTSNEDLLNQISAMRSLQSNIEMTDALQSITTNQQLSTAATFIGKTITGTDANGNDVQGIVDRAFTDSGNTYVGIGDSQVQMSNISAVQA